MKISGKKKSFQTAMAVKMATIEIAGSDHRQDDPEQDARSRRRRRHARRLLELARQHPHEIGEDEDRERDADRRINEDQAEPASRAGRGYFISVNSSTEASRIGSMMPDEEQAEHGRVPAEPVAAEREGRHRRDEDGQHDRAAGHDEAVDEILAEIGAGPRVDEIVEASSSSAGRAGCRRFRPSS